jgi:hypothetical protein
MEVVDVSTEGTVVEMDSVVVVVVGSVVLELV